jgi:nitrous oxidase accessory protein NosD
VMSGRAHGPRSVALLVFFLLLAGPLPVAATEDEPSSAPPAPAGMAASLQALDAYFAGIDAFGTDRPEAIAALELIVPEPRTVEREQAHNPESPPRHLLPAQEGTTLHPPIQITADEGPGGFVLATVPITGTPIYRPGSGVVAGTGTADDPYIIEGWAIDARAWPAGQIALQIRNTNAHVVIRGNDLAADQQSVLIDAAANVRFEENRLQSDRSALDIRGSDRVHVSGNRFVGTPSGVLVIASTNTTVEHNGFQDGVEHPITVENAQNVLVAGNAGHVSATAIVATASSHLRILDNAFHLERNFGVSLFQPEDAVVAGNTFIGGYGGIWAESGSAVRIEGNTLRNETGYALLLQYLDGVEVLANDVRGARDAVHAHDLGPILLAGNRFESNDLGLFLRDATGAVIRQNVLESRFGEPAMYLFDVDASHIEANEVPSGQVILNRAARATLHDNDIAEQITVLRSPDVNITANRVQGDTIMGGLVLQESPRPRITDNEIHSAGWATVYAFDVPDALITANLLQHEGSGGEGLLLYSAAGVEISDNHISADYSLVLQHAPGATITKNSLNGRGAVYYAPASVITDNLFVPTEARKGDLDLHRVGGSTITGNHFTRGGILLDGPELHDLLLVMDDSNLVAGRPITYRAGAGAGPVPADPAQVILVDVQGMSLHGFSFREVSVGVQIAFSPDASITESTFDGGTAAIFARNSDDVQILQNTIAGAEIGIIVLGGHSPRLEDNSVTAAQLGIIVGWSEDPHIADNGLIEVYVGVAAIENTGGLIHGSHVQGSFYGVAAVGADAMLVRANRVENASIGLLVLESNSTALHNNEVANSFEGLRIEESAQTLATHNRFQVLWTAIRVSGLGDAGGHVITENDLLSTSLAAIAITPHEVDARNNWWGCAEGPTAEGCGGTIGDIRYEPWATAPIAGAGLP